MEAIIFVYEENRPVNYRAFAEWLFRGTPNLIVQKDCSRLIASSEHVVATLELDLGVSKDAAVKLLQNAERLGFLYYYRGCYCMPISSS